MRILRTLSVLIMLVVSGVCFSAEGQQLTSTEDLTKPMAKRSVAPEIPGDLSDHLDDSHDRDAQSHLGKKFWIPWILNAAFTVTSIELTENCLHSHQCVEGNPLFGKRPSRLELYGVRRGLLGAGFYLARKSKQDGGSAWKYTTVGVTTAFAADTAWDAYGTATRGGTQHPSMVANMPASQFEIISTIPSKQP